jgi:hypothetical protein
MAGLLSCETNHAPDVPDLPAGLDQCYTNSTCVFTAVASDPDRDNVALRFDWGDSTASHWEGWFASGETVVFTHAWSETGTYKVRVSAQDHLLTSEFSEARTVQVMMRLPPDAPGKPSGPSTGGRDTVYDFRTGASHPDWAPVAIRFAWGDGDTSDWSEFVLPSGSVEMSHSWSAPGTYPVSAQAKDTFGLMSQWSAPRNMVIRQPVLSRLMMVGAPSVTPDGSGFLINAVNDGMVEDTINWLQFFDTPDSAYMREFRIDAQSGYGFPVPTGQPGAGLGDTVRFAPVTIAPDMSRVVELLFMDFHSDPLGNDMPATVYGKHFVFRFSDGSEITVDP